VNALASNLGGGNSAFGIGALRFKQLGGLNTAMGDNALFSLTGLSAMNSNNNTALGAFALFDLTAGDSNTAVGLEAGQNLTTGNSNTIMGFQAGTNLTTGNGNIYIASPGTASESNTIRIGNAQVATFIAGINGVDEGNPTAVFINTTTGQLGTTPPPSSRQYKKEIKPMDKVSEAILALKPVTFQYKSDNKGEPQFGLIAEEVAKANRDLVIYDRDGNPTPCATTQ
jgi:Chaperone of endosialidase